MRKIILTHLSDSRKGESQEFAGEVLRIGRGEWNELVFAEPRHTMVSRSHAEITFRDVTYVITDSNSSTGTYVNGEKISHRVLKSNDILRFGKGGPEVSVVIPSSDLKATVVVSPLQPTAGAPKSEGAIPEEAAPSQQAAAPRGKASAAKGSAAAAAVPKPSAAKTIVSPPPAQPQPARDSSPPPAAGPASGLVVPAAPARADGVPEGARDADLALLQSQLRRLTMIAGGGCVLLLLMVLFAVSRVTRLGSQVTEHTARLEKLDATTAELLQRISTMDTKNLQQVFQHKSREIDQKSKELDRRGREMEQKFQSMFDRKSREVDAQFELLGQAYPQVRRKMEELRRRRE